MKAESSKAIADNFLPGAFDVLNALLSLDFRSSDDSDSYCDLTTDKLSELLGQYPVAMTTGCKRGGGVAILMSVETASVLAALTLGEEPVPKEALSDGDLSTLKEVSEAFLGGGVSRMMEVFAQPPEQLKDPGVSVATADDAASLMETIGEPITSASIKFAADPHIDGSGVFLFSQNFEEFVSGENVETQQETSAAAPDLGAEPQISEAEMSDILSGFTPPAETEMAPEPEVPSNIGMVLDLNLVATARLGRVYMSIKEILALGQGSIIEVGHLVDEPVELLVNEKLVARGDVVVVDEKFGLRITEIVSQKERIESLR